MSEGADGPAQKPGEPGIALELLVHGVGGATPEKMLDDPRTVRITGDDTAAVFRRADDADAETGPRDHRDEPVPEAYVWCNLTSGNSARALWLLLLPFMVVNLAHWMRPRARGRDRTVRLYGLLVRLTGLTLTVLLVAAACEVALDLTAWQCAGRSACAERHSWLGFLSPEAAWPVEPAGPPARARRRGARRADRPAVVPLAPYLERVRVPAADGPHRRARRGHQSHRPGSARLLVRAAPGGPAAGRAHRGWPADGRRGGRHVGGPFRSRARRPRTARHAGVAPGRGARRGRTRRRVGDLPPGPQREPPRSGARRAPRTTAAARLARPARARHGVRRVGTPGLGVGQ